MYIVLVMGGVRPCQNSLPVFARSKIARYCVFGCIASGGGGCSGASGLGEGVEGQQGDARVFLGAAALFCGVVAPVYQVQLPPLQLGHLAHLLQGAHLVLDEVVGGARVALGQLEQHLRLGAAAHGLREDAVQREGYLGHVPQKRLREPLLLGGDDVGFVAVQEGPQDLGHAGVDAVGGQPPLQVLLHPRVPRAPEQLHQLLAVQTPLVHVLGQHSMPV
eukprot:CAMPEP_0206144594 /NCGR_PEP_ID=MMETSP1473-20131121/24547_1 /ASSEMBLY_ACC=CAM_ASM_001109 /TAXON_ID=1461547 /ORGANISM="Stichococcus sp, Strain RCC1054" /LENGTH=218 /DNA_ID=CAMNT_0053540451 /DNA_START=314 /DNA_END=971 /DNA_ORIENTATION=-